MSQMVKLKKLSLSYRTDLEQCRFVAGLYPDNEKRVLETFSLCIAALFATRSKMLSVYTLKGLKWLIQGAQRLRISIFAWDSVTSTVLVTKSKTTWFIVIAMVVYLLLQFVFEVFQLCRLANDPTEPFTNYMKLIVQCSTRMFGLIITVDGCIHGDRRACFVNQILVLNKRFKEVEGGKKLKDTMRTLSRVVLVLSFGYPVVAATGFLEDRYQSRYWHHLVFPPNIFPFTLPFICFMEYLMTAQNMQGCIFYLIIAIVYFRTASAWMKLVIAMNNRLSWDWRNDTLSLFRTMQVYNQIYNNRIALLWTYQMGAIFILEVLCVVSSLRLTAGMPFPTNLMFPVGATTSFFITTVIYKATTLATGMSQELANSFKKSANKYHKRLGRSMRPLYVEVRPFFVMKKTTSFSFTNEAADITISILLST